ncbi:MAG TPA: hypothetical protein VF332_02955 [Vicinamibacterales bacterium]
MRGEPRAASAPGVARADGDRADVKVVHSSPGQYELQLNTDGTAFTLTAVPKETGVFVMAITRLAAADPPASDTHVTFDKVGSTYYLSEVWLPGEDGYLVYAAKVKHTHQTVKGTKKAK